MTSGMGWSRGLGVLPWEKPGSLQSPPDSWAATPVSPRPPDCPSNEPKTPRKPCRTALSPHKASPFISALQPGRPHFVPPVSPGVSHGLLGEPQTFGQPSH